jgi:His-Xaa-Ser system protein HxsD
MFGENGEPVEGECQLTVELPLYGEEGLFRACYAFTDRCFLFLREAGASKVTVIFRKRHSPKTLDALVEEFANELISQRLRAQLAAETKSVREMIVAQAFGESDL